MEPAAGHPNAATAEDERAAPNALAYHRRTVHSLSRYARGPEALDWELQPTPFRRYEGCLQVPLLHVEAAVQRGDDLSQRLSRPLTQLHGAKGTQATSAPVGLEGLGAMLELAFGITAWKSLSGDRWAVRANPSSGNLHPVEAYVLCVNVAGLEDGVYHYCSLRHILERRAVVHNAGGEVGETQVYLLLSTIPWREAWKYGERAFRYCQLDVGHALASVNVAAAALDWTIQEVDVPWQKLQQIAGLDRREDFPKTRRPETEWEEAELVLRITSGNPGLGAGTSTCLETWSRQPSCLEFVGSANLIDRHPLYSWPVVAEVMSHTRPDGPYVSQPHPTDRGLLDLRYSELFDEPSLAGDAAKRPTHLLVRQRRSAQRFDGKSVLPRRAFERLLAATYAAEVPSGRDSALSNLELVLWVHRVEGLEAGVYVFGRHREAGVVERTLCTLHRARRIETSLPGRLWRLAPMAPNVLAAQARTLHCHQDIAATSCLTLGWLCDVDTLRAQPGFAYRQLLRSAGRLVHGLYLGAELEGLSGTGIGCFFDDAVAEFLGISATSLRSVYHFCMGKPLIDPRVETQLPYAE